MEEHSVAKAAKLLVFNLILSPQPHSTDELLKLAPVYAQVSINA